MGGLATRSTARWPPPVLPPARARGAKPERPCSTGRRAAPLRPRASTPRTVQRWLAAEEGRAVQSRPPGGCRRGQYRDGTRQTKSRGVVLG